MKNYKFDICNEKPEDVVSRVGRDFMESTRSYVRLVFQEYSGPIFTTYDDTFFDGFKVVISGKKDIQDQLGAVSGDEKRKFELYLTSKVMENLKWRIMFLRFGYAMYPLTAVVEERVANQVKKKLKLNEFGKSYVFQLNSSEDFEAFLQAVFSCDVLTSFVQSVITESKRREKEADEKLSAEVH
jgi:hypothetical protein